uniref:BZIP domain-containing protein n=1 Tax=Lotharella globosa TaxID=91324 RepID=A0A7S4DWC9_9EUKA|mmetsp:Transcript_14848/g.30125  ORF Transcript_14848/g.30125 Transcript_14848/m.30125 type:complete len:885 (+) Transcript_14848:91-2745(+)
MSAEKPEKGTPSGGVEGADAFEELEKNFDAVLQDLASDKNLDRFREEYHKLYTALKKSHQSEQRLIEQCRKLNNEIVANASKVQSALRLSRQDHLSIQILKKEIDKAWKMVDSAKEREKQSRETIHRLRDEVQNLSKLVDQGAGLNMGHEKAVTDLTAANKALDEEVSLLHAKLADQTRENKKILEKNSRVDKERDSMEAEKNKLQESSLRLKGKLKNMDQQIVTMKLQMQNLTTVKKDLFKTIEEKSTLLEETEKEKKHWYSEYVAMETEKKDQDNRLSFLKSKIHKLELDIEKKEKRTLQLVDKLNESNAEVSQKKKEIGKLNFELQRSKNKYDKLSDLKDKTMRNQKAAEETRDRMLGEMKSIRKDVMTQRKHADLDEKLVKELQGQVKRLASQLLVFQEKAKEQQALLIKFEQDKKDMNNTLKQQREEGEQYFKEITLWKGKRAKAAGESASWQTKYLESQTMITVKNQEIDDLKKLVLDGEKKLKLQKSLYEQVRADRNFFSKKHVQSQDEIAEMKSKFKIMNHQIEQLKEQIQLKDNALINEHFSYKQLNDEMKVKDRRLNKKNEVLETADKVLANQNDEIKNLRRTLEGAEYEQQRQKKIYDDVIQERDILAAQLIRRNDELALLYEKIRIQQSTLSKGEVQYRERVKDIQMMKLQLNNMKREIEIRNQEVVNTEALKNELYNIQRELLQEKTKVKALSEELENPMNVHRWRQLEGSDPKRWELIQKIQTLQKRLIEKTELAVEKDMLLQEKEKLYVELKNILARQPGPEVAEQLSIYQQNLKEKTRQMKAMAAELNMHQAQVSEYRYEIERLSRELQDSKRKFFEQKRKDQIQKEIVRDAQRIDPSVAHQQKFHLSQPKVAGGGFNLTQVGKPLAT